MGVIAVEDSEVAVILEDIRSQFRVFGEGLQALNEKVDRIDQKLDAHIEENRRQFDQNALEHRQMAQELQQNAQEHRLMLQMIKKLNEEQTKLKQAK